MTNVVKQIYEFLDTKKMTISFCESASAGALSSMFCEIDGISKVYKGAIIAYSNEIKKNVVKVSEINLEKYGAVSSQVATEMAKNTAKIFKTDICISITGNASNNVIENKKACFYYVGIFIIDKVEVFAVQLENQGRNYNRFNIALYALNKLLEYIK